MPFYRCMPPSSGGGGGGGSDMSPYITFERSNGQMEIPKVTNTNAQQPNYLKGLFITPYTTVLQDGSIKKVIFGNGIAVREWGIGDMLSRLPTFNSEVIVNEDADIKSINYLCRNDPIMDSIIDIRYNDVTNGGVNIIQLVSYCTNFNNEIRINPDVINSASGLFMNCTNYNRPFTFGKLVSNVSMAFSNTSKFNSRVLFKNCEAPDINARMIFTNAYGYNQPFIFPKHSNYNSAGGSFTNCYNFNQPIMMANANNVLWTYGMMAYCNNFASNIIFPNIEANPRRINGKNMFLGKPSDKRVNIYINGAETWAMLGIYENRANGSITNTNLTWVATTNGYYSPECNVYVLNNVSDAINWFNNYWYNLYGDYPDLNA